MSETVAKPRPDSYGRRAVPLLKEYSQRLQELGRAIRQARNDLEAERTGTARWNSLQSEFFSLKQLFLRLKPAAVKLAQNVSQHVEHAKMNDLTRLELSLRLAEFEHALLGTEQLL